MKDILTYGLIILLPYFISGQSTVDQLIAGSNDILKSEVLLEPSFSAIVKTNTLSVYPRIIKEAQVFVLHFNQSITDPYCVEIFDSEGVSVEMIYNSQLSVFKAKSSLSLEIMTPLEPGLYHVVLTSKEKSQATKLLKF